MPPPSAPCAAGRRHRRCGCCQWLRLVALDLVVGLGDGARADLCHSLPEDAPASLVAMNEHGELGHEVGRSINELGGRVRVADVAPLISQVSANRLRREVELPEEFQGSLDETADKRNQRGGLPVVRNDLVADIFLPVIGRRAPRDIAGSEGSERRTRRATSNQGALE
jgi:hypothetical protein